MDKEKNALAQREPVAREVNEVATYIREYGVSGLGRYGPDQIADLLELTETAQLAAEQAYAEVAMHLTVANSAITNATQEIDALRAELTALKSAK